MFKKILVPYNGFGLAGGVLPFIPQLARGFGSSVILLWVMTPGGSRSAGALTVVELEEAARRLAVEVGHVEPMVSVGSPAPTIIRIAAEEGCDLIAMATHGRGFIGRGLLGSVADEVVRYSTAPTMVFAPGKADKEWDEISELGSIVVPLDGSSHAESVLPYVEEMARRLDLEVILVRVSNHDNIYAGQRANTPPIPVSRGVEVREENYLETLTRRLQIKGLRVRWELLSGSPAHKTAEFAKKTKGNIVALATRGHSGIERYIEGSVSEQAILGSGDPVLIIPPGEEE